MTATISKICTLAILTRLLVPATAQAAPPNVVIILSDDQAWGDYGFMGHPHIQTPHLDKLASQSLVFTRGYVPTSLCRPSLMSIITGLYPHQHRITGNDPPKGTDRREMLAHVRRVQTLPKLLGERGYVSFQSGKWWEGNFAEGGFTAGMTHGDPARGGRHGDVGLTIGRQGLQPVFDFLDQRGERPFLLWYAPMLPHSPHNPPERLLKKYLPKSDSEFVAKYWAMCEWWDESVGKLLAHLDEKKLADNTIVVYVTDNGWIQEPAASRYAPRSKRSPYEGGIRTPILVRWPAGIKPARDDQSLASSLDIAPTILTACGIKPAAELPGLNLLDKKALSTRDTLVGEIYEHDVADLEHPTRGLLYRWCIRENWKLVRPTSGGASELFNLSSDPAEQKDLASQEPARVKELNAAIDRLPVE